MHKTPYSYLVAFVFGAALTLGGSIDANAGDLKHKVSKMFKELDANADGTLARSETGSHEWLAEKFDKIDADRNGQLTVDEVVAFKKAHKKNDGDCDKPSSRA